MPIKDEQRIMLDTFKLLKCEVVSLNSSRPWWDFFGRNRARFVVKNYERKISLTAKGRGFSVDGTTLTIVDSMGVLAVYGVLLK